MQEATPDHVDHVDDRDEDDHHGDDPNDYLVDDPYDDGGQGPVDDAPLEKANDLGPVDDPVDKSRCNKRLFCSQDTPVVGSDQVGLSEDELQGAVEQGLGKETKKARERQKKNRDSMSQPVAGTKSKPAHRAMDRVVIHNWHSIHQLGKPMLPERLAKMLTGDMLSLHDGVLFMEERLLRQGDPTYPVFITKVPDT